jgi:hypothetical protein
MFPILRTIGLWLVHASAAVLVLALWGCAKMPNGPYGYVDYGQVRVGGDYIKQVDSKPGKVDPGLEPPNLLFPSDRMVFSHYPREIVFRWNPVDGTPADAQYLFEEDFTCDDKDQKFGDWSREPEPMFAYLTGKTTLNDRFVGAQPGRWRVKLVCKSGESNWSSWKYFLFTQ